MQLLPIVRTEKKGPSLLLIEMDTESSTQSSQELVELSPVERQVAQLAIQGFSDKEIAQERKVSIRTVANQLRSIYQKWGIASRVELAGNAHLLSANSKPSTTPLSPSEQ